ncbi:shikimate dehydrogenase [Aliiruegeria lutimaris]|uniref:Shikimate dehydrogenase (NADP(+)) n=1 Tax=Aliiruegeria lutimaris TaxID=571298 RepID=A0A1G8NEM6_9RHOB|nr:shikimate dehydrogenase [Aliiruegeria lutimaris]SDI77970.1 shikimate dehydrogenase [Aliiruegeria lutimaris]
MTARIPLAGVIGSPVAHSLSPRLHGHWLKTYGVAGHYIPMDIAQSDLAEVLQMLPRMGFVGVNVTIPHKETALSLANLVTDRAALIGAANTLIFHEDGRIHADNTDGYGFLANLRQNAPGWDPQSGPAAVFGAGGAARAIVTALIDAGAPTIRLTNRTRGRAEALRSEFGPKIEVYDWVHSGPMLAGAATVVNTTSLGMVGKPEFRVSLDALDPAATVNDLVYAPLETPFLRHAAERGCRVVDGLGMLLHQAAPGFERWFGIRPEVTDELRQAVLAQ